MRCCNGNHQHKEDRHEGHRGHLSHIWMMLLCCGAPVLILLLLPAIRAVIPGAGNVVNKIIPFLCPLMMFMMLPMMFRRNKADEGDQACGKMEREENKSLGEKM